MKNALAALAVGFIFALGLGISGMTQPAKVVGFLDIFGNWDPSLMFVMIGAISVHSLTFRLIRKRNSPLLSTQWHLPTKTELTPSLILGSLIFGIGWGMAGYCPGPAVTSLASFTFEPVVFVVSMLVGMWLYRPFERLVSIRK